jgi:hypothetical protein
MRGGDLPTLPPRWERLFSDDKVIAYARTDG